MRSGGDTALARRKRVDDQQGLLFEVLRSTPKNPLAVRGEARFRANLAERGATPLYTKYLGSSKPHKVRCERGHECSPRPTSLQQGTGVCWVCALKDPMDAAESNFLSRLSELGATPLYDRWLGAHRAHLVRCSKGHDCSPRPRNVARGQGVCRVCAQNDPAEKRFLACLAGFGAVPLYTRWQGVIVRHKLRCAEGHVCSPLPHNVMRGHEPCLTCSRRNYPKATRFYIVVNHSNARLKFGVTSGNGRMRLREHERNGYDSIRFLGEVQGAYLLETQVLDTLAASGIKAVSGREYFDLDLALDIVLDVVEEWIVDGRLLVCAA